MKSLIFAAFLILGITPAQAAFVEAFALPSDGSTVNSANSIVLGTSYTIEVSGTFEIGCIGGPFGSCPTDAEYYVPATGVNAGLSFDNTGFSNTDGVGLDVGAQINGENIDWGLFQDSRIYSILFIGLGDTIGMRINDSGHGDNVGSLLVTISTNSTIPAVPVPAAFWLFGTALIGFIGISRRRKVA
jgi:hypothetical protein